jgi:hypothetical protein
VLHAPDTFRRSQQKGASRSWPRLSKRRPFCSGRRGKGGGAVRLSRGGATCAIVGRLWPSLRHRDSRHAAAAPKRAGTPPHGARPASCRL